MCQPSEMNADEVLAFLQHHLTGMSAASETGGLKLTANACANTARELELSLAAVAALVARNAELEHKAGLWDSLMAARDTTAVLDAAADWKVAARDPRRKVEAVKLCRAAHGLSLLEAKCCVEAYIRDIHAEPSHDH